MDKASQTPRISQAAIKSFFCLFDKHCWEKLPNVKELLQLPDVQAIISQHSLSIEGIRVKIVRQFKNWSDAKTTGSEPLCADDSVLIFVRTRAGNIPDIVLAALGEVSWSSCSPYAWGS